MRTTLTIDDDVLIAAKAIADRENRTLGQVVSNLVRTALQPPPTEQLYRNGIPLLPKTSGTIVTREMVNALRDEAP